MDTSDADFLKRLKATFRIEAEEHVQVISAGLIELEKVLKPEQLTEVIETVFREAHSLKGAARSVDLKEIESICQPLEGAFSALKSRAIAVSPALCDLFHRAVNAISLLLSAIDGKSNKAERPRAQVLIQQLENASRGDAPPRKPEEPDQAAKETVLPHRMAEEKPALTGTVRISTARLDKLLSEAEEMVLVKMAAGQRIAELQEINGELQSWKAESAKWKDRVSETRIPQIDEWQKMNETYFRTLESRMVAAAQALERDQRSIKRMVDEHLEEMKSALMLPVALIVEAFPKIVRDLTREQGKEAELVIRGAEIEIDKRILEELKDPLIHLIRNCVDHGIHAPEERVARNKAPRGTITISFATKESRQVEILVSDDGVGIDVAQVREAAIKMGVVSREAAEKLDEREALSLIFQSGISTSPFITDVSGRGLGLAIVREKVEKLGGVVSVDTKMHAGTTIRLFLPMTLASYRGVLVRVDEQVFVLPTTAVERTLKVNRETIKTVENRETIQVDGRILSMVRLGEVLELPHSTQQTPTAKARSEDPSERSSFVILASADTRIAFQVDEILDEQQIMLKGFGKQLQRVRNVAGAAILGNGKVVPVLNTSDLMKSAVRTAATARSAAEADEAPSRERRVLVAEDSITARTLIKNILETSGYRVTTAVDGADAFTKARDAEFDIVVSDVDMPLMSGFELTTRIRADKKLGELPVVLVTALESREDRERGIEVGANAYIVKSSFDMSNLLEVVKRLI